MFEKLVLLWLRGLQPPDPGLVHICLIPFMSTPLARSVPLASWSSEISFPMLLSPNLTTSELSSASLPGPLEPPEQDLKPAILLLEPHVIRRAPYRAREASLFFICSDFSLGFQPKFWILQHRIQTSEMFRFNLCTWKCQFASNRVYFGKSFLIQNSPTDRATMLYVCLLKLPTAVKLYKMIVAVNIVTRV